MTQTTSTTTFDSGDVVLVRVPFTNLAGAKQRPALVLSTAAYAARHRDLILLPLTSVAQADAQLGLQDWRGAGLIKPTWAKPVIASVSDQLVLRRLGRLTAVDTSAVRYAIRLSVDHQWL